ncbi:P63C domain-containing protein [Aeromonas caviae]|uniref:P63C domain-containing protein n=1 Tax=Aeromonas caviae TaxID=648 RepID=UPI001F389F5B|nr:P63C domain-containing protein [Aeromonas caviae]
MDYIERGAHMEGKKEGRSAGGYARAAKMTPEERIKSAKQAALAKKEIASLPKATHGGDGHPLKIGNAELVCYVLEDGTRLITQEDFLTAIGRAGKAKGGSGAAAFEDDGEKLPSFIAAKNLKPFIKIDSVELMSPIIFRTPSGSKAYGYRAELLPKICRIYLEARDAGALLSSQIHIGKAADLLMRGLAEVGIIALVDEATGYQRDREKNALAKILESFVAKELQPWLKTFPDDYYREIFRLYDLTYPPVGNKSWRPGFIGTLTNDVVYARLAPELLPSLKKEVSKAKRRTKLHQWLTGDLGHPKLREHIASVVTLLKLSKTPADFKEKVDLIHPRYGQTYLLDFSHEDNK